MRYIPHTETDKREMLEAVGVADVDALFEAIPTQLQLNRPLDVPSAMSEPDLLAHMQALADANVAAGATSNASFLGGGVYRHYVPTAVSQLLLRGELYTAYTPYQPEVAQGTLQILFEFQTMVSELLGMEVVNASMYDGSTAMAEAALMALRIGRKKPRRVVVSGALHPEYRDVTRMFLESGGATMDEVGYTDEGVTDLAAADRALEAGAAALIVGYPTFFGTLDDLAAVRALCDARGAMMIVVFQEALAFGLLEPPGNFGADIVVGEGQSLGVPQSFGGPHLGLFATRTQYLRQMPGRIAGQTLDDRGNRGFVLTLSTREQHIRREKATSNICTNQGLMSTAATIYMTLMGPSGLAAIARASHLRAEQVKARLLAMDGYTLRFSGPTFHEFVIDTPHDAAALIERLVETKVIPGLAVSRYLEGFDNALLITTTELTRDEDIERLVEVLTNA